MNYIVIDIEASSLSADSYPIEFAWGNFTNGIQSFLINPSDISNWTDWNLESERIHNIPYAKLLDEGVSPADAWNVITSLFVSHHVYSDKPVYDENWLHSFGALGVDTSIIRLNDTGDLIRKHLDNNGMMTTTVDDIYNKAAQICPPTHRAAADVEYLLKAIELSYCSDSISVD